MRCPQLPEQEHIRYVAYDFKAAAKRPGAGLLADIAPVIARCLDATGVFLCAPAPPGLAARRAGPIDWVRSAQDLACGEGVGRLSQAVGGSAKISMRALARLCWRLQVVRTLLCRYGLLSVRMWHRFVLGGVVPACMQRHATICFS